MRLPALTAFIALACLVAGRAAEAKIQCPGDQGSTRLTVDKMESRVTYKSGHTRSDLQRIQRRHGAQATASGWYPLGLTLSELRMEMRITTRAVQTGPGRYCSVPDQVEIRLGYPEFTIYVDRRYIRGSCEYRAISDHEDQHVKIYRDQLDRHVSWVRERMGRAIGRLQPNITASPDQGAEQIKRQLNVKLTALLQRLQNASQTENGEIDSPGSYRRVQSRCRNW